MGQKDKTPIISVIGNPYELGYQHGRQAREAVDKNFRLNLELWKHFSGLNKNEIIKYAQQFIPHIQKLDPQLIEELKGLAEGSGNQFEEIVALNCRYELSFAFMSPLSGKHAPQGCTAYALTPEATRNQHVFVGQNWDYKPTFEDSCIVLRITQGKKPNIIIHTEAGIIGHKGFNSAGIGVCLNFIRCEKDLFEPGPPISAKVRSILNSHSFVDCIKIPITFDGPNSVNMVIAHREGEAIDVECTPSDTLFLYPVNGILTHTNHFLSRRFALKDTGKSLIPDTVIRSHRVRKLFQDRRGALDLENIKDVLKDHFGQPNSICRHRDGRFNPNEQWETLTSMIIDLTDGKMIYTKGPPCSNPYETVAMDLSN